MAKTNIFTGLSRLTKAVIKTTTIVGKTTLNVATAAGDVAHRYNYVSDDASFIETAKAGLTTADNFTQSTMEACFQVTSESSESKKTSAEVESEKLFTSIIQAAAREESAEKLKELRDQLLDLLDQQIKDNSDKANVSELEKKKAEIMTMVDYLV